MSDDAAPEALSARRKLMWATGFCFVFMIVEIIGGYLAGSLAIMTDAAHMLSDVGGFCISLFALWLAEQPATVQHSYGYHRAEILGALASVLLIWALTGALIYEAIGRTQQWFDGTAEPVDGLLMSGVAFIALVVNLALMAILGHGHSHGPGGGGHGHSHGGGGHGHSHGGGGGGGGGHGHSHGGGAEKTEKSSLLESGGSGGGHGHSHGSINAPTAGDAFSQEEENINVRAAYIHAMGDLIQSLGVLLAGVLIWYRPDWQIADPICTLLFSVLVMWTTVGIVRSSLHVLMEGVPDGLDLDSLRRGLQAIDGVTDVHDLHVWSLTVGKPALSVHLKAVDPDAALRAAQEYCHSQRIDHTTIQVQRDACVEEGDCAHPCVSRACADDNCA